MSDNDEIIEWRQLREFTAVDLTRSFVLSWHVDGGALIIDIDVYLTPEHPFYEKPRPAEKVCIRPAYIEFPFCESLRSDGGSEGELADIAGNFGHGALKDLRRLSDAHYEISGEFGTVFVDAERPLLRLK
ncbi:MAG: hypothetical protein OEM64_14180 [Gammaproteobacteria bacterium]|nr:hypothetical protein [Gammaproteobacteria bacterium]MDH3417451.1 hypothetical protein [Gammaproteobacteria bacterium]